MLVRVYWDTSWKPAFLSGTVPCNSTYLPGRLIFIFRFIPGGTHIAQKTAPIEITRKYPTVRPFAYAAMSEVSLFILVRNEN
jgi:hypothetical protein